MYNRKEVVTRENKFIDTREDLNLHFTGKVSYRMPEGIFEISNKLLGSGRNDARAECGSGFHNNI